MKFLGNTKEFLHLDIVENKNSHVLKDSPESSLTILWIESGDKRLILDLFFIIMTLGFWVGKSY